MDVKIWRFVASFNQDLELHTQTGDAACDMTFKLSPLKLDFCINQNLQTVSSTFKGSTTYDYHQKDSNSNSVNTVDGSNTINNVSLVRYRFARCITLCDPGLNVTDDSSWNCQPNTFKTEGQVSIPLTCITKTSSGSRTTTIPYPELPYFDFVYDFSNPSIQGSMDYHLQCDPECKINKCQVSYTLTQNSLSLKYTPMKKDMTLDKNVQKGKTNTRVNPFFSYSPGDNGIDCSFLHGNNKIQVMVGNKDASASFAPLRLMRIWTCAIDDAGHQVGQEFTLDQAWEDDNISGSSSWIDVPGMMPAGDPKNWSKIRSISEFLVMVTNFPEFGFLYYAVVIDTIPGAYRIRMSAGKNLTSDKWCEYKNTFAPICNEGSTLSPIDTANPKAKSTWTGVKMK